MRTALLTCLSSLALAACGSTPPPTQITGTTAGSGTTTGASGTGASASGSGTGAESGTNNGSTGTSGGSGSGGGTSSGTTTGPGVEAGTLWIGGAYVDGDFGKHQPNLLTPPD